MWYVVNGTYFSEATIGFIFFTCIFYFYWYLSYIFKQVNVLVWLQLDLVWDMVLTKTHASVLKDSLPRSYLHTDILLH